MRTSQSGWRQRMYILYTYINEMWSHDLIISLLNIPIESRHWLDFVCFLWGCCSKFVLLQSIITISGTQKYNLPFEFSLFSLSDRKMKVFQLHLLLLLRLPHFETGRKLQITNYDKIKVNLQTQNGLILCRPKTNLDFNTLNYGMISIFCQPNINSIDNWLITVY